MPSNFTWPLIDMPQDRVRPKPWSGSDNARSRHVLMPRRISTGQLLEHRILQKETRAQGHLIRLFSISQAIEKTRVKWRRLLSWAQKSPWVKSCLQTISCSSVLSKEGSLYMNQLHVGAAIKDKTPSSKPWIVTGIRIQQEKRIK